jgi:hypothetical protein
VEQEAADLQNARQLVVKRLRIELTCNTEARRIVQDRVDRTRRLFHHLPGDVALLQYQAFVFPGDHGLMPRSQSTSGFFSKDSTRAAPISRHQCAK